MTGKKLQKKETQMTGNFAYIRRPAVYGMFKSQEKVKEIKVEKGEKRKKAEEILSA
jgi:hypothetical protein